MTFFSSVEVKKTAKDYQIKMYEEDYNKYILAKEYLAKKNKIEDVSDISEEAFFSQIFNHTLNDDEFLAFSKKREGKKKRGLTCER